MVEVVDLLREDIKLLQMSFIRQLEGKIALLQAQVEAQNK